MKLNPKNPADCEHDLLHLIILYRKPVFGQCANCKRNIGHGFLEDKTYSYDKKYRLWVRNRPMEENYGTRRTPGLRVIKG